MFTANTVWMLMVVALSSADHSLQKVFADPAECAAHRAVLEQKLPKGLAAVCVSIELRNGS